MRIAVDVTPMTVPRTGIGNYLRGAIEGLERAGCDVAPFAVAAAAELEGLQADLGDRRLSAVSVPVANLVRRGWSALGAPPIERLVGYVDGTLLSDWWYPPQQSGSRATVVHDLVPLRFPEWVSRRTRLGHRATYRNLLPTCDVVFANSWATADDVSDRLGIPRERIHVAYPGVDARFTREGRVAQRPRPYVVVLGTLEPRKNLGVVAAAKRRHPDLPDVVLVGGDGWGHVPDLDGIERLGYLDDDEVPALLRGAACLVFPSLYEGFGMPVIEAMACGCPVACSSAPSLDEAAGDAAVRFDPRAPDDLHRAVGEAIRTAGALRARGVAHARRFTWAATGAALREGYERNSA